MWTVLVDMDAIVASLSSKWYPEVGRRFGDHFTEEDVNKWDLALFSPHGGEGVYDIIKEPGFYRDLPVIPGAREALHELSRLRINDQNLFDIYFLTAAHVSPWAPGDKLQWIDEHFSFIGSKRVITAYHKELIKGNFLIDDSPRNLEVWKQAWPDGKTITIDYPYNRDSLPDFRAIGFRDKASAWDDILWYMYNYVHIHHIHGYEKSFYHRYMQLSRTFTRKCRTP